MKKILQFLLPILILMIGFLGYRYMVKTKPKNKPIQIEEQTWMVATLPVIPTTLSPTITLYGRVESPRSASLRAPTLSLNANAEIKVVNVLEGQHVQTGERLIQLDDKDSLLNLKQRETDIAEVKAQIDLEKQRQTNNTKALVYEEALLKLTRTALERLRRLKKQRVSTQSALDEAQQAVERQMLTVTNRHSELKTHPIRLGQLKAQLNRALIQRDIARLELQRTQIKAPFAGIIAKVSVAVGDRVRSGDTLLSLYDTSALEVRAQIPGRYQNIILQTLANGQQLQAYTQLNEQTLHLRLDRISGQINPNSGGIDGLFHIEQNTQLLRLGQFVTLSLKLPKQHRVIALPFEAVYGTNQIYKLVEGRMKPVTIERVGEQKNERGESKMLIRSSELQIGDQIIITQLPNAMDGLKVRVLE